MMSFQRRILGRLLVSSQAIHQRVIVSVPRSTRCYLSTQAKDGEGKLMEQLQENPETVAVDLGGASSSSAKSPTESSGTTSPAKLEAACGDEIDDDEEMEQEEMFVEPHESFEFKTKEWGGPRRGGRLLEPTRYGDWERKGRCTDFS